MTANRVAQSIVTVKSHRLPRSVADKIGRRGEYNIHAALNHANRQVEAAAQVLRATIAQAYGDGAASVIAHINSLLDEKYPRSADPTRELVALAAIANYYRDAAAQIEAGDFELETQNPKPETQNPKPLYDLAKTCIQDHDQWYAGQTRTIWTGQSHSAYVAEGGRDGGGILYLAFRNGSPQEREMVEVGQLNPTSGWTFTLTEADYRRWVERASKLAGGRR